MTFFGVFVRRPVLALMVNLALLAIGLFCYLRLPVEAMPRMDYSTVKITTTSEGANPSLVASQISMPVEDAVAIVSGIEAVSSESVEGKSTVEVSFGPDKNLDQAVQELRDQVAGVRQKFPTGTVDSVYEKAGTGTDPMLTVAVTGPGDLSQLVRRRVVPRLRSVTGVAAITVFGDTTAELRLEPQPAELWTHRVGVDQLQQAIAGRSESAAGDLVSDNQQLPVRVDNRVTDPEDWQDLVLRFSNGVPVTFGDLGLVSRTVKDPSSVARLNGQPTITLKILKSADANTLNVATALRGQLASLEREIGAGLQLRVIKDTSVAIVQSFDGIKEHLFLGTGLACLVVLLMLGDVRATLIVSAAIPVSLIATFIIFYALGYTLNSVTMLALTLAVGLVIDDAIVVLESIYRGIQEDGLAPAEAAERGMADIGFAVVATTLSLVVMFLPLTFLPGSAGRVLSSFGVTMGFSILMSMVVSFTLTPMLCSRLLDASRTSAPNWLTRVLQAGYVAILKTALRARPVVLLMALLTLAWGAALMDGLATNLYTPDEPEDYTVQLKLPAAWPLTRMASTSGEIAAQLQTLPGVKYVMDTTDLNGCEIYVRLLPLSQRRGLLTERSMAQVRGVLARYPDVRTFVTAAEDPLEMVLAGPDASVLARASERLLPALRATRGFIDVDSDAGESTDELRVVLDPAEAGRLNVAPSSVASTLSTLINGQVVSAFAEGDQRLDVTLRLPANHRAEPDDLEKLAVPTVDGKSMVPLLSLVRGEPGLAPSRLTRYQRQPAVTLRANVWIGQDEALAAAQKSFSNLGLAPGYSLQPRGAATQALQGAAAIVAAALLGVSLIYMVLASQFEDLLDPLIILLTLPLAVPFALYALWLAGMKLNLFSGLGIFLLLGVVKKNAILQIDHTNALVAKGVPWRQALIQANSDRLRPILMTTLTLVVAMLPVALAGPTGAMRAPMAVVVVGGQTLSLLLTLLIVPVASSYRFQLLERLRR